MLFSLVFLLDVFLVDLSSGIVCYSCDALRSRHSDCPGWNRRPVDTFKDLHDKGGLYTHCVEIRMANGTVLHQGPYPESPTCSRDFLLVWKHTLEKRYRHRIYVKCCEGNLCNRAVEAGAKANAGLIVLGVAFVVAVVFGGDRNFWTQKL